jgi:hypothetical protein
MNQDGTRDLQWWHAPRWVPRAPRIIMVGLVSVLAVGLANAFEDPDSTSPLSPGHLMA